MAIPNIPDTYLVHKVNASVRIYFFIIIQQRILCLLNISFLQMLPKIRIRIAIKVGSVPTVQHIECTDPKHYANDKDFGDRLEFMDEPVITE